jgi:hypothetical protein
MRAIPNPVGLFNIILSIVVNGLGIPFHPVQEDGMDVFKSEIIPDVCQRADQSLNPLDLAILQAGLYQIKEPEIEKTVIWRIGWVRSSGKSPVFNFGRDLLAIVTPRIVHVKEKTAT